MEQIRDVNVANDHRSRIDGANQGWCFVQPNVQHASPAFTSTSEADSLPAGLSVGVEKWDPEDNFVPFL